MNESELAFSFNGKAFVISMNLDRPQSSGNNVKILSGILCFLAKPEICRHSTLHCWIYSKRPIHTGHNRRYQRNHHTFINNNRQRRVNPNKNRSSFLCGQQVLLLLLHSNSKTPSYLFKLCRLWNTEKSMESYPFTPATTYPYKLQHLLLSGSATRSRTSEN